MYSTVYQLIGSFICAIFINISGNKSFKLEYFLSENSMVSSQQHWYGVNFYNTPNLRNARIFLLIFEVRKTIVYFKLESS